MKENNEFLFKNNENNQKAYGKTFPLGFKEKGSKQFCKTRKSKNSSKSESSESIEEKNEELEDENYEFMNKKNNSKDSNLNNNEINEDLLVNNEHALNEDSDSEIVEEEIISEEIIAQLYKNEEMLKEKENLELNLNSDNGNNAITPISESIIVKEINLNETLDEKKLKEKKKKDKKEKIVKKKENILFKYFNHKSLIGKLRIITFIILILYECLVTSSIVIYATYDEKKTLFCFEFLDKNDEKLFLSDRNSFFIVHILLSFAFLSVINTLVKNEYLQLKQFFKETSLYFPLTLIVNIPIFLVGIFQNKYDIIDEPKILTPIIFSILTFLGLFFMGSIYINIKRHKYKSISNLINISVLCSFLAAFECYCFIYCICFLIKSYFMKIPKDKYDELMSVIEIIAGMIFYSIGFLVISAYQDIYFSAIVVIIEIGLLYIKKNYSIAVVIFNIFTTFFSFASIIVTIFKYKKRVFGLAHVD